jgi:hypothetical protein
MAVLGVLLASIGTVPAEAGIHRAPVVLKARQLKPAARYPLSAYRLYRRGSSGEAVAIPFQIDEITEFGDFVLPQGPMQNSGHSNGYFDKNDELSFMGDDVGPLGKPESWPDNRRPQMVYEIRFRYPQNRQLLPGMLRQGAVYLGVHLKKPPPREDRSYVVFDQVQDQVKTSRYTYHFDPENYLVVNGVSMRDAAKTQEQLALIRSSTFYMKADLKYFLTVEANHRSVRSRLEAFKSGPVRTIVRVTFFYTFLKLNFEVGMYTEVSFFSNSVILPAVMHMPIDGTRFFNDGSHFYYGFAFEQNPATFDWDTNMPVKGDQGLASWLDLFRSEDRKPATYWASVLSDNAMFYWELDLSKKLVADDNYPRFYREDKTADQLAGRDGNALLPLGKSPVNMALSFDLTKFRAGEHQMAFRMYFENQRDKGLMDSYRHVDEWTFTITRM